MKVAVTAQGRDLESPVDPRFGRAQGFILYDTDTKQWEAVDNTQNLNAASGAGIQAASAVAEQGVQTIVTGHCGPKAFRTLQAAGINVVVGASGTVKNAIDAFTAGQLKSASAPDVAGHW